MDLFYVFLVKVSPGKMPPKITRWKNDPGKLTPGSWKFSSLINIYFQFILLLLLLLLLLLSLLLLLLLLF